MGDAVAAPVPPRPATIERGVKPPEPPGGVAVPDFCCCVYRAEKDCARKGLYMPFSAAHARCAIPAFEGMR